MPNEFDYTGVSRTNRCTKKDEDNNVFICNFSRKMLCKFEVDMDFKDVYEMVLKNYPEIMNVEEASVE